MLRGKVLWFGFCLLAAMSTAGWAEGFEFESAGVRGGASATSRAHNFHQAEGFVSWNLPWYWNVGSQWRLQTRLQFSAGWLADPGGNAFIGTLGPTVALARPHFPFSFEGGVSPTLLSQHQFATKDFGTDFQFTSHLGIYAELSAHFRLGYRFQHMSDAGLASSNPGLNLHVLSFSYKF